MASTPPGGGKGDWNGHTCTLSSLVLVSPAYTPGASITVPPGAVAAVPVEGGADGPVVVMVRQWRPVMRAFMLEIPAGKLDVPGEDPDDAMARELAEEIQQRPGRLVKLSTFWNSPGFSTELTHVYIALDLSPCDRPEAAKEEEQDMTIERFPLADTGRLVATGEITDAKTIIGLALAERYLAGLEPEAGS